MQFNFRCSTFISTNLVSTFLQDNAHRNQCFETQALLKQKFLINFLQTFQPKILLLFCYPQSWSKLSLRKQPFLRAPRCFLRAKRLQWQRARRNRCFNRLIATLSFGSCWYGFSGFFSFFFKMLHWHEQGLPPVFLNSKKGIPQIVKFCFLNQLQTFCLKRNQSSLRKIICICIGWKSPCSYFYFHPYNNYLNCYLRSILPHQNTQ